MRLSLKERKFIFLPTFSLPSSSSSLLKVPNMGSWSKTYHVVISIFVWFSALAQAPVLLELG